MRHILDSHGIEFKVSGHELVCVTCPFCGDTGKHFYVNAEKETYFCHKCLAKGHKVQLQKHFGDLPSYKTSVRSIASVARPTQQYRRPPQDDAERFHRALMADSKALDYCRLRGFEEATIRHWKLGLMDQGGTQYLSVPYFCDGKLMLIKGRSIPPAEKTFWRTQGCASPLFNQDAIRQSKEIIITEGELDAISVWQAGFQNVISVPNGCNSFTPEFYEMLKDMEKIYLWYDSDDKGEPAALALAKRFGLEKCYRIRTSEKDANAFFASGGELSLSQAYRYNVDSVSLLLDSAWELLRQEKMGIEKAEVETPWYSVNKLMGGCSKGDLIVVSATPKTGKTSWCLNIASHIAKQGHPVLFYCLEMRPERLAKKIMQAEMMLREEQINYNTVKQHIDRISGLPLYFAYNFKDVKIETVSELIRESVKRYGLKAVFFDNLHILGRSIDHSAQEIGLISRTFKLLAEELEIPIFLIAQPRKVKDGDMMSMSDLKDSSSIGADADQVVILYRKRAKSAGSIMAESSLVPETIVRVEASRYTPGGDTMLYFKGDISKFTELGDIKCR